MKRPNVLNSRFVETVKRSGRYGDGRGGNGLFLNVKPAANGRWSKSCEPPRVYRRLLGVSQATWAHS